VDVADAMASWVKSPGHFKNMIDTTVTDFAGAMVVGSDNVKYWAQCFGAKM
jgi:uncharacterized protein YkwD